MDNPAQAPIQGYDGPADAGLQQYWLDVAWRQLQREDRTLVERIAAGAIDPATVADVVYAAARRVLRNPDGVESGDHALDDYREGWKKADATEDIYFTAAELRRLAADDTFASGWSGSIKYC